MSKRTFPPVVSRFLDRPWVVAGIVCAIALAVYFVPGVLEPGGQRGTTDFLTTYMGQFDRVFSMREDLVKIANDRWDAYHGSSAGRPVQPSAVAASELADFEKQLVALPSPPSDPLLSLDSEWRASISQLRAAEESLGTGDSALHRNGCAVAAERETRAFQALCDYLNTQPSSEG